MGTRREKVLPMHGRSSAWNIKLLGSFGLVVCNKLSETLSEHSLRMGIFSPFGVCHCAPGLPSQGVNGFAGAGSEIPTTAQEGSVRSAKQLKDWLGRDARSGPAWWEGRSRATYSSQLSSLVTETVPGGAGEFWLQILWNGVTAA